MKYYNTLLSAKVETAHKTAVRDKFPKRKETLQIGLRKSKWKRRIYILLKQQNS